MKMYVSNSETIAVLTQLRVAGDIFKENVATVFVIHATTDVLEAVAHDEVIDVEQQVIGYNLVENLLLQRYGRGFILDNHPWLHYIII